MKTLDNIMHAILIARDLRLVRDFLSFSNKKNYFYKFRYVTKYMRKIADLCFYFLLKKKLGKSTFFWFWIRRPP